MGAADAAATVLPPDVVALLSDPQWRIRNLYTIRDRDARTIPFVPNYAQDKFLRELHNRCVILKARQRGFSTLIQLLGLDQALWNENYSVGIIAHTLEDAGKFLDRIRFAYDRLHPAIRAAVPIRTSNASSITFANGSDIRVDTSMRSSTLQFLHVSEFGKICAKFPDKAREIITGTLPALAPTGLGFIESTAEGNEGYFYEMVQEALRRRQQGLPRNPMVFELFFYSWWDEPAYRVSPDGVVITREDNEYFDALAHDIGRPISLEQRAWYVAQRMALGNDKYAMFQEMPSTVEEAFSVSTEGYYYRDQLRQAREQGRIGSFPWIPSRPVLTFWDIGANDETAIWFGQYADSNRFRFIDYLEASGEPFSYFIRELQSRPYVYEEHWLPHDAASKRQMGLVNLSAQEMLQELAPGWRFDVVDRVQDIGLGIQQVRDAFPIVEIDQVNCARGLRHLENYRKEWNERLGVWRSTPRHDAASNGADAFRQFAQLYAVGRLRMRSRVQHKYGRGRNTSARSWRTV